MSAPIVNTPRRGASLLFLVLFAMVCGIVGVAFRLYSRPETVQKPAAPPNLVPVASGDLKPGRILTLSDIYTVPMSGEIGKLAKGELIFTQAKQLAGRVLKTPLKSGQPFVLSSVYLEGTGPTPAELLSPGMRAATVRVTLVGGLRGFAGPETWVDVLFRRKGPDVPPSTDAARTHTLLAGVRILAIQDNTYANTVLTTGKGKPADQFELTLELTPEQSEVLKSVEDRGDLSLNMLPRDPARTNLGTLPSPEVMKLMLGVEDPKPVPPVVAVTPPPSVRIVRGGAQSSVTVDFPTDLIMDRSLYPAPAPIPDPPVAPPAQPIPSASAPAWPQLRTPVPSDHGTDTQKDGTQTPRQPEFDPASTQPQRRSVVSESSIIVRRTPSSSSSSSLNVIPSMSRQNVSGRVPIRPATSSTQLIRSSRQPETRLQQTRASIPRMAPSQARITPLITRSRLSGFSASGSSRAGSGRLPLMVAGPRTPTSFAPYSDNRRQSRSPIYASDPRRPLVVGPQVLSSSTRQTSPIRRYPSAIITGREIVLSNAMLSRSSSLPLLKSGPQD
jgi:Flp pilus assembly protein CpaB